MKTHSLMIVLPITLPFNVYAFIHIYKGVLDHRRQKNIYCHAYLHPERSKYNNYT